jgi:hypothetical protein
MIPNPVPLNASTTIRRELLAARQSGALFKFALYCEDSGCAARITSVTVKDWDSTLIAMLDTNARAFRCLVCGGPLRWEGWQPR